MPRLHALELVPDEAGDDAVRRDWQVLRDLGLPSQLDHTGGSNSPHVTLVALPAIGDDLEGRAVDALEAACPPRSGSPDWRCSAARRSPSRGCSTFPSR